MRIGVGLDTGGTLDDVVTRSRALAGQGMARQWASQIFGHDALTALAVVARSVDGLSLGTAVVPVHPRHPAILAAQALTAQDACRGRLTLGIGLSHQLVVENVWGLSYARPAAYMEEYLSVLLPLLAGEQVSFAGEMLRTNTIGALEVPVEAPPPVLLAALAPRMLRLAAVRAAGTVTWMTGAGTIASHVVPTMARAAEEAGRPAPEVVVCLPVCVTDDAGAARDRAARTFAVYGHLPSYRRMLDLEGAAGPADIGIVGTEAEVGGGIERVREAGATELVATVFGTPDERRRTEEFIASLV